MEELTRYEEALCNFHNNCDKIGHVSVVEVMNVLRIGKEHGIDESKVLDDILDVIPDEAMSTTQSKRKSEIMIYEFAELIYNQ